MWNVTFWAILWRGLYWGITTGWGLLFLLVVGSFSHLSDGGLLAVCRAWHHWMYDYCIYWVFAFCRQLMHVDDRWELLFKPQQPIKEPEPSYLEIAAMWTLSKAEQFLSTTLGQTIVSIIAGLLILYLGVRLVFKTMDIIRNWRLSSLPLLKAYTRNIPLSFSGEKAVAGAPDYVAVPMAPKCQIQVWRNGLLTTSFVGWGLRIDHDYMSIPYHVFSEAVGREKYLILGPPEKKMKVLVERPVPSVWLMDIVYIPLGRDIMAQLGLSLPPLEKKSTKIGSVSVGSITSYGIDGVLVKSMGSVHKGADGSGHLHYAGNTDAGFSGAGLFLHGALVGQHLGHNSSEKYNLSVRVSYMLRECKDVHNDQVPAMHGPTDPEAKGKTKGRAQSGNQKRWDGKFDRFSYAEEDDYQVGLYDDDYYDPTTDWNEELTHGGSDYYSKLAEDYYDSYEYESAPEPEKDKIIRATWLPMIDAFIKAGEIRQLYESVTSSSYAETKEDQDLARRIIAEMIKVHRKKTKKVSFVPQNQPSEEATLQDVTRVVAALLAHLQLEWTGDGLKDLKQTKKVLKADTKAFQCGSCERQFAKEIGLVTHIMTSHGASMDSFKKTDKGFSLSIPEEPEEPVAVKIVGESAYPKDHKHPIAGSSFLGRGPLKGKKKDNRTSWSERSTSPKLRTISPTREIQSPPDLMQPSLLNILGGLTKSVELLNERLKAMDGPPLEDKPSSSL